MVKKSEGPRAQGTIFNTINFLLQLSLHSLNE